MTMENGKYRDLFREGIEVEVKRYVENINKADPPELTGMSKEALVYNLTENATPIVRQLIDRAIDAAAYKLLHSIRWAKQNPDAGTYGKKSHN